MHAPNCMWCIQLEQTEVKRQSVTSLATQGCVNTHPAPSLSLHHMTPATQAACTPHPASHNARRRGPSQRSQVGGPAVARTLGYSYASRSDQRTPAAPAHTSAPAAIKRQYPTTTRCLAAYFSFFSAQIPPVHGLALPSGHNWQAPRPRLM